MSVNIMLKEYIEIISTMEYILTMLINKLESL